MKNKIELSFYFFFFSPKLIFFVKNIFKFRRIFKLINNSEKITTFSIKKKKKKEPNQIVTQKQSFNLEISLVLNNEIDDIHPKKEEELWAEDVDRADLILNKDPEGWILTKKFSI